MGLEGITLPPHILTFPFRSLEIMPTQQLHAWITLTLAIVMDECPSSRGFHKLGSYSNPANLYSLLIVETAYPRMTLSWIAYCLYFSRAVITDVPAVPTINWIFL